MDEQNQQPVQPEPLASQVFDPEAQTRRGEALQGQVPPITPQEPKRGWVKPVLIALIILPLIWFVFQASALFFFLNPSSTIKKAEELKKKTQTSTFFPTPTPDLTANWKTYINIKYGYLIKYPSDVKLEPSTEEAIGFFRNEVAKSGTGGQGRCCGMTIYSRTYDLVSVESQSRPIETINVGGYSALRWSDNPPFLDDIWIPNPDKGGAVRITISTLNAIDPYNKEDYEIFEQILSTFRFLNQAQVTPINPEGRFCGGIAGNLPENQCPTGYRCQLDYTFTDRTDSGGKCVKQ